MENTSLYSTFESFRPHFDALARVGYFKIVLKPLSHIQHMRHYLYKILVWILVSTYNLQHVIRVIQVRQSTDQIVDTLFVLLTTLNTYGKQVAFNVRSQRIDRLVNVLNGPTFAPTNSFHEKVLKDNAVAMSRLLTLYHGAIFTCGTLWTIFPLINRAMGQHVEFTGYFPFNTSESPAFELALAYMSILITFQAYGNVTMDCTIVAFYAQGKIQLQKLRYNLEHLLDLGDKTTKMDAKINSDSHIKDIEDDSFRRLIQRRLATCVEHYREIVWFIKEVESVFGEAMVLQFFVMSWVICMTVYKIVGLNLLSAEFVSMAVYLGCMLAQLFIYCYYGTQVKVESEFVNQSIYCCDWISLSPRFRRQLLVMMERCSRPLEPRTAYIIPMSLETYIAVLRSSYTLFTFLNRK